jgi:AbrB family looped-hinge helix DNA binding protein
METTKLSSKGQVVLPKSVRDEQGWAPGTEFTIESTSEGVTLRVRTPFQRTDLGDVFGSVKHRGRSKTLEEMDAGIGRAVARRFRRSEER